MKILVTGATGFIGHYVVQELLNQGHQVIATSKNQARGTLTEWSEQVEYIPYDIHDLNNRQTDCFRLFQQPALAIHLAWEGLPNYHQMFHIEHNLPANYWFLKNLVEHGLPRLIVCGTCFEYGMQNGALAEWMDTRPITPYALAKDTLRKFLEQLHQTRPFELTWIRLFYLYGKGQPAHTLLAQLDQALHEGKTTFNMSGGEQLRDYLPVRQAAKYIMAIALQNHVQGIINCCSGVPIAIRTLVENYLKTTQQSIQLNLGYYPYPEYEPMAFWGNPEKLRTILPEAIQDKGMKGI